MSNERIKELYDQCFVVLEHDTPNTGFDIEKFAELIVRECADIVLDCSVEYTTRPQIAQEIKEHFGVE